MRGRRSCVRQSALAVGRHGYLVAFDLEIVANPVGQILVVFDDQNALHASERPSGQFVFVAPGKLTTNRAPRPGAPSTHARPPCRSVQSRTTERPMPVPAMFAGAPERM